MSPMTHDSRWAWILHQENSRSQRLSLASHIPSEFEHTGWYHTITFVLVTKMAEMFTIPSVVDKTGTTERTPAVVDKSCATEPLHHINPHNMVL
jgi:hypothetical protein